MAEEGDYVFSDMMKDFNSIYRSIKAEDETINNMKDFYKTVCNKYDILRRENTYLEALHKEKTEKEELINNSITSVLNTKTLLKEHKNSLLKELKMEQKRTLEEKKNHDAIISKHEASWERYKEMYSKFPLACEREKVKTELKLKKFQLLQAKAEIMEVKQKCLIMEQIREHQRKVEIVKLAKAWKDREASSKDRAKMEENIRKLKDEIKVMKSEKKRLMNTLISDKSEGQDIIRLPCSLPLSTTVDVCLNVPQLQLPPWYSPPRKILHHEHSFKSLTKPVKNNKEALSANEGVDGRNLITREQTPLSNIRLQIGSTNLTEMASLHQVTVQTPIIKHGTAEKDHSVLLRFSSDATIAPDNRKVTSTAEPSQTLFNVEQPTVMDVELQQNSEQLQLLSEECMDQTPSFLIIRDQTLLPSQSTQPDSYVASPVSSPEGMSTDIPEDINEGASGENIAIQSTFEKENASHKVGPCGDYQECTTTMSTEFQQQVTLHHRNAVSQEIAENADQSAQSAATDVDNRSDLPMNVEEIQCFSPDSNKSPSDVNKTSEDEQCQVDYCYDASPEICCNTLSPQADYLMCSPNSKLDEETGNSKSSPFAVSPELQSLSMTETDLEARNSKSPPFTTSPELENVTMPNTGIFGAPSNQQTSSGFNFNFASSSTMPDNEGAGGERRNPSEAFQFNFDKKTSSRSFFKLF